MVFTVILSKRPKMFFKTDYCLMQVRSIAECSKGSILQYFRPSPKGSILQYFRPSSKGSILQYFRPSSKGSILQYFRPTLSYQLSLRPLFCLFLSGPFKQVCNCSMFCCKLLYVHSSIAIILMGKRTDCFA